MSIVPTQYICLVFKFTCFVHSMLPSICVHIMSATSLQNFVDREGPVQAGDSATIVKALSNVNVDVTTERVRDALDAMGFHDDDTVSATVLDVLYRTLTADIADDATLVDAMECSDPQPGRRFLFPFSVAVAILSVLVTLKSFLHLCY